MCVEYHVTQTSISYGLQRCNGSQRSQPVCRRAFALVDNNHPIEYSNAQEAVFVMRTDEGDYNVVTSQTPPQSCIIFEYVLLMWLKISLTLVDNQSPPDVLATLYKEPSFNTVLIAALEFFLPTVDQRLVLHKRLANRGPSLSYASRLLTTWVKLTAHCTWEATNPSRRLTLHCFLFFHSKLPSPLPMRYYFVRYSRQQRQTCR